MAEQSLGTAPILNDDKQKYFYKITFTRLTGGFKLSDEDSNLQINALGYIVQTILYILFPAITIVLSLVFSKDDIWIASIISGAVAMILNIIIQLIILNIHKKSQSDSNSIPGLGISDNNQMFIQIIKPKIKIIELGLVIIFQFILHFLFTYHLISVKDDNMLYFILGILTLLVTSYSLVVESPREAFSMIADNNEFHFYSTLYNRVYYMVVLGIIKIIILESSSSSSNSTVDIINLIIGILPFLYFFAIIGPIFSTLMYIIEKYNFWLMGIESSVSDIRTIAWAVQNTILALIIYIIYNSNSDAILIVGLSCVLVIIFSENFLFSLGDNYSQKNLQKNIKIPIVNIIWKIAYIVIFAAVGFVIPVVKLDEDLGKILMLVSVIIAIFLKIFEYLQSAYFFGFIRSLNIKSNHNLAKILYQVEEIVALLAISIHNYNYIDQNSSSSDNFQNYLISALLIRTYRHLLSDLQMVNIIFLEVFVLDINFIEYAPLFTILNIAIANILRRFNIWIYQIIKMVQDKKQRINNITLFMILSFTLLLPMNLIAIIVSSLLDTPFVPFLGLPLFVVGFPRPKRQWPELKSIIQSTGESMLYNVFASNFSQNFKETIHKYKYIFTPGKSFLVRIDKYLAILQILETGREHSVIHLRGAESQDPVSCHSHEAIAIDELITEAFDKKKKTSNIFKEINGSLIPITQFPVDGYQENQIKLTGIVEQQEFQEGFRQVYLRMIVYFINKYLTFHDKDMINTIIESSSGFIENHQANQHFPDKWSEFINFNCDSRKEPLVLIKKKQIDDHVPLKDFTDNKNQTTFPLNNNQKQNQNNQQNNNVLDIFNNNDNNNNNLFIQPSNQNKNHKEEKKMDNGLDDDFLNDLGIDQNYQEQYQQQQQQSKIRLKLLQNSISSKQKEILERKKKQNQIQIEEPIQQMQESQHNIQNNNSNNYRQKKQSDEFQIKNTSNAYNNPSGIYQSQLHQKSPEPQIQQQQEDINEDLDKILNLEMEEKPKTLAQQENVYEFQQNNSNFYGNNEEYQPKPPTANKQKRVRKNVNDQFHKQIENQSNEYQPDYQYQQEQNQIKELQSQQQNIKSSNDNQQQFNNNVEVDYLEDLEDIIAPMPPPPPPMFDNMDMNFDNNSQKTGSINRITDNANGSPIKNNSSFMQNIKILTTLIYAQSTGDFQLNNQSLNKSEIYKGFSNQETLQKSRFLNKIDTESKNKILEIQKQAIRFAFKISSDSMSVMMTADLSDEELKEGIDENNEKDIYIGMGTEKEWEIASKKKIETLWNLNYSNNDNTLGVYISKYQTINCSFLQFNEDIINGIWANLMFELYYVTNDDDERYSIQTHKKYMRNIIIENSEQPLGYAPFYSGPIIIKT